MLELKTWKHKHWVRLVSQMGERDRGEDMIKGERERERESFWINIVIFKMEVVKIIQILTGMPLVKPPGSWYGQNSLILLFSWVLNVIDCGVKVYGRLIVMCVT